MQDPIRVISGALLLVIIVGVAYLNFSFYASVDVQIFVIRTMQGRFYLPGAEWVGLAATILTGVFLFCSISPKR